MYTQEDVFIIIKDAIKDTLGNDINTNNITTETNLVQEFSFDSLSFIKLIVMIEDKLDITFSIESLDIDSIEKMSQLVEGTYKLYSDKM